MNAYEPWLNDAIPLKGDIFIDVGANRGIWARELAARFRYGYAIEPNPEVLEDLRATLPANVKICPWAAWYREEKILLAYFACRENLSFCSGMGKPLQEIAGPPKEFLLVAAHTLDSQSYNGNIDFIKIDTEGSEFHVISGAKHLLLAHRPRLLIEIHSAENGERISKFLWFCGYSLVRIADPEPDPKADPSYPSHRYWIDARP